MHQPYKLHWIVEQQILVQFFVFHFLCRMWSSFCQVSAAHLACRCLNQQEMWVEWKDMWMENKRNLDRKGLHNWKPNQRPVCLAAHMFYSKVAGCFDPTHIAFPPASRASQSLFDALSSEPVLNKDSKIRDFHPWQLCYAIHFSFKRIKQELARCTCIATFLSYNHVRI